jgi:rare lipoprotein A (peptidoglycan hydrolase)
MTGSGQISRMRRSLSLGSLAAAALCLAACAGPFPDEAMPRPLAAPSAPVVQEPLPRFTQMGLASWYGPTRKAKRTANGETMSRNEFTAAHRTLPMDTMVRVTNLDNGLSTLVRINDRGPFIQGRVIDLSPVAATTLGMKDAGVARVRLEVNEDDQRAALRKTASVTMRGEERVPSLFLTNPDGSGSF